MSTYRVVKDKGYFVANNLPFNDRRLSWEASGVMGYLLSKPDGWKCRNFDLVNQRNAGQDKVKRIISELKSCGYLHRYRVNNGEGKFEWITDVYEDPANNPTVNGLIEFIYFIIGIQTIGVKTTNGLTTNGLTINGKQHHIVSTNKVSTNKVNTSSSSTPADADEILNKIGNTFTNIVGEFTTTPLKPILMQYIEAKGESKALSNLETILEAHNVIFSQYPTKRVSYPNEFQQVNNARWVKDYGLENMIKVFTQSAEMGNISAPVPFLNACFERINKPKPAAAVPTTPQAVYESYLGKGIGFEVALELTRHFTKNKDWEPAK